MCGSSLFLALSPCQSVCKVFRRGKGETPYNVENVWVFSMNTFLHHVKSISTLVGCGGGGGDDWSTGGGDGNGVEHVSVALTTLPLIERVRNVFLTRQRRTLPLHAMLSST